MHWESGFSIVFVRILPPSLPETEEDDGSISLRDSAPIDSHAVWSIEPGCEDRVEDQNKPKRKWKRKIYPASAVHRSARNRTTKKFHDEI